MESKEPTNEKIIEAVKSYYGLKIDDNGNNNLSTRDSILFLWQMMILFGFLIFKINYFFFK